MNDRRLRILRVITRLPVGGIERKIVEVLPRLVRDGFEVSLVCLRERGPLADELAAAGVPVECIPFRRRWDLRALRRLASLMRERAVDVVHSHMYRSNVPATVAARMAGVPRVWCQVHNVDTWETVRQVWMDRRLCRWREGVIAVSEQVKRDVEERLRLAPERVPVVYNGVDRERFGKADCRESLRRELSVDDGALVFVMAARMVEQKRPRDFIDLAGHLLEKRASRADGPELHFWLMGDGGLLDEMKRLAQQTHVPERVRFLGRRDDVERVMAAADVFVMPSTKEGFSNALLEAMASGLAVIATDVGGNAEAVRDGQDGLIVPALNPVALRSAAERLIDDPGLRHTLACNARLRTETFSLESMVRRLASIYRGEKDAASGSISVARR